MVGSLEEDIENVSNRPQGKDEIVDDFNEVEFDKKKGVQFSEVMCCTLVTKSDEYLGFFSFRFAD